MFDASLYIEFISKSVQKELHAELDKVLMGDSLRKELRYLKTTEKDDFAIEIAIDVIHETVARARSRNNTNDRLGLDSWLNNEIGRIIWCVCKRHSRERKSRIKASSLLIEDKVSARRWHHSSNSLANELTLDFRNHDMRDMAKILEELCAELDTTEVAGRCCCEFVKTKHKSMSYAYKVLRMIKNDCKQQMHDLSDGNSQG